MIYWSLSPAEANPNTSHNQTIQQPHSLNLRPFYCVIECICASYLKHYISLKCNHIPFDVNVPYITPVLHAWQHPLSVQILVRMPLFSVYVDREILCILAIQVISFCTLHKEVSLSFHHGLIARLTSCQTETEMQHKRATYFELKHTFAVWLMPPSPPTGLDLQYVLCCILVCWTSYRTNIH